jgi:hypothetical protein
MLRLLKDNEESHPRNALEGAVEGHPSHSPQPSDPTTPLEQCHKERICTKPVANLSASVAVVDVSQTEKAVAAESESDEQLKKSNQKQSLWKSPLLRTTVVQLANSEKLRNKSPRWCRCR